MLRCWCNWENWKFKKWKLIKKKYQRIVIAHSVGFLIL
jgi:hypothetical protein